jgi:hypothetical protein
MIASTTRIGLPTASAHSRPSWLATVHSVDRGRSPNTIFHCPTRDWFDVQAGEIAEQVSSFGYAVSRPGTPKRLP